MATLGPFKGTYHVLGLFRLRKGNIGFGDQGLGFRVSGFGLY